MGIFRMWRMWCWNAWMVILCIFSVMLLGHVKIDDIHPAVSYSPFRHFNKTHHTHIYSQRTCQSTAIYGLPPACHNRSHTRSLLLPLSVGWCWCERRSTSTYFAICFLESAWQQMGFKSLDNSLPVAGWCGFVGRCRSGIAFPEQPSK